VAEDDDKPVPGDDDTTSAAGAAPDSNAEDDAEDAPTDDAGADDGPVSDADADDAGDARAAAKERALTEARAKAKAKAAGDESTALAKPETAADRQDLPKWNRARVKRKAPAGEETDAFQDNVRKAGRSAVSRAPVLIGLAAVIAGGIGGYIWWSNSSEAKVADQTQMLAAAAGYQARGLVDPNVEAMMAERVRPPPVLIVKDQVELDAKIDGALAGLADAAPDSPADVIADLIRGSRHMRAGAFAEAQASFESFLTGRPKHELSFLAVEGVLLAKEAQGDREGALATAAELLGDEPGAFYRDQALWHQGRLLEALGRTEEATTVFRQYAQEYPLDQESVAKDQVIERLRGLDPDAVANLPAAPAGGLPPGMLPPGVLGQ
jgi:tetratricopeptide (TPR) repeat protein